jgi:hypothetical protein
MPVLANQRTAGDLLICGMDFTAGNLSGSATFKGLGRIQSGSFYGDIINTMHNKGLVDYWVYSYNTPIAYRIKGGNEWVVFNQKWSVTTSKHTTIVKRAIKQSQFGGYNYKEL